MKEGFLRISKIFAGALLILFAVTGFLSLYSYNPYDPSWNFSSQAVIKNWAGVFGANLSALYLSFFGYGGYYISFVFLVWGMKIIHSNFKSDITYGDKWYNHIAIKFAFLLISSIFFAATIALFDKIHQLPEAYASQSNGGFVGFAINQNLQNAIGVVIYSLFFIFLTVITAVFTLSVKLRTWWKMMIISYLTTAFAFKFVCRQISAFVAFVIDVFSGRLESDANVESANEIEEEAHAKKSSRRNSRKIANKEDTHKLTEKIQHTLDMEMRDAFQLPPFSLLNLPEEQRHKRPSAESLQTNAEMLEKVLGDFGVQGKIIEVQPGPVVTLYSLEPSPGTRASRVIGLSDDVARSMSAVSARIAGVPGQNVIGIELPNAGRETVYLKELLLSPEFKKNKFALPLCLGKDISGKPVVIDLAKTPHLLVAGTTGSGKSVGLNGMIVSLLYKYSPMECKFIMIDPKMLELSVYQDIPHLLSPVVTEPQKAIVALKWTVKEMENRYRLMSQLNVRNIDGYNEKIIEAKKAGRVLTRNVQTG